MSVGVCWGKTFVRQHFGEVEEIGFLCGVKERVVLFHWTKPYSKGERKVIERYQPGVSGTHIIQCYEPP